MISSGVTMSVPFAMGKIIDTIYVIDQNKDEAEQKAELEERLKKICAILTGVFVVGALCNMGRVYLIRVAAQNITARIRNMCYSSIMSKNITFFDKNKTGELINRLSADSQLVSQTITQQVSDGLRSGMMTLFGVGMMVYMSPSLALMGLMVVPLASAWAVVMGRKVKAVSRQVQDSLASATDLAEERIANIRTVNAFAKQHLEINEYEKRMQTVLDISAAEANIHAKFYGMVIKIILFDRVTMLLMKFLMLADRTDGEHDHLVSLVLRWIFGHLRRLVRRQLGLVCPLRSLRWNWFEWHV